MSREQIRAFLAASQRVELVGQSRQEVYRGVDRTLQEQDYRRLNRSGKGLVRRYQKNKPRKEFSMTVPVTTKDENEREQE